LWAVGSAAALGLAAALTAGQASAAIVISDDMGTLLANHSLSDSVSLTFTPPGKSKSNGKLVFAYGMNPTQTLTGLGSTALDLTFDFQVVGAPLTLVYADAINPTADGGKPLGGAPFIFLNDITTSTPVTTDASFESVTFPIVGLAAVTNSVTLQPGLYSETIMGTLAKGNTDLNVGAFAKAAAPEPATWSMMLFGLALIGGGLRLARRSDEAALPTA